jgi:hypothetical protein
MSKRHTLLFVAGLLVLALVVSGCTSLQGGGWIAGAPGDGKATFGFQMTCDPDTNEASGQLQYHDHAANVAFHGVVDGVPNQCGYGEYTGTYTPQPKNLGPGGTFLVEVTDGSYADQSDTFEITLIGGVYDGYSNAGELGGGNITGSE